MKLLRPPQHRPAANVVCAGRESEIARCTIGDSRAEEAAVKARGFAHDRSPEAPVCRWVCRGMKVDLMPTEPLFGFHNRWYPLAVSSATRVTIPTGATIRLIRAPVFLGTKLEAFSDRGAGDFLASHDLEDVLTIADGREELVAETSDAPAELKRYLVERFSALLATAPARPGPERFCGVCVC